MRRLLAPVLLAASVGCASPAPVSSPVSTEPIDFDAEWNYGDPAATEARFRELLPAVESAGDLERVLELETQIARTKSLRREIDAAHGILDDVEARLDDTMWVAPIRVLLERGRTLHTGGDPERSVPLFLEAWERARLAGAEFHAVDAAHMLGIVSGPDERLAWTERAIAYAEGCTDERARGWLGSLLQNMWYTHLEKGDLDAALTYAERCRAFHEATGNEEGERVGRWLVFHTTRRQGHTEEALVGFQALLADYGETGDPGGYTEEELGECLHALGRPDEAGPFFARAYDVLSRETWLVESEPERIKRLKELGGR